MSPSARGVVSGLFLALVAALGVLSVNTHWLFPAQGETGVRYVVSAPALAGGRAAQTPWLSTRGEPLGDALAGRGRVMPALMSGLVRQGARPHVSALWVLAGSAAVAVFAVAWAAGGAAGIPGALAAGLALVLAPSTLEAGTVLGPDLLLAALAALVLGVMTYQPRWSWAHGVVAAAAWLAHPAGVGLVAVAMVWPFIGASGQRRVALRWVGFILAAVPTCLLLATGPSHPVLMLPDLPWGGMPAVHETLAGVLAYMGAGLPGAAGVVLGAVVTALLAMFVVAEAGRTPVPPEQVHWSDPAAPDILAAILRPAAGLVALGAFLGACAAWSGEELSTPWVAAAVPLATLGGVTAVRWGRRVGRVTGWMPAGLLAAWLLTSGVGSALTLQDLRASGRGYTAAHWVASPVIYWLDNRSAGFAVVYSDQPALVLLQTGRPTREVHLGDGGMEAFAAAFALAPGALVLTGPDLGAGDVVAERMGLEVLVDAPDGKVLAPPAGGR